MSKLKDMLLKVMPGSRLLAWQAQSLRRRLRHLRLSLKERDQIFVEIYRKNKWNSPTTRSGKGSDLAATATIRDELPKLIRRLEIKTILDAPCGDFHWMKTVDLGVRDYVGADIVSELIAENQRMYGGPNRRFVTLDLCRDPIPPVNLIMCRDGLVHLSDNDVRLALENFKASGSRWLLTTNFPNVDHHDQIATGMWRPLNICRSPFNCPPPIYVVSEGRFERNGVQLEKSIALWRIADLP